MFVRTYLSNVLAVPAEGMRGYYAIRLLPILERKQ